MKTQATRIALIGLIGTMLTVCGGLVGSVLSAGATIYSVERERQRIELTAPESQQALNIDTGSMAISRQQAAALDPAEYFVELNQGFVLRRPLPGWDALEQLTLREIMAEQNALITPQPPTDELLIYRMRYGEPVEFQFDEWAAINGWPIPQNLLDLQQTLYGPPPWTQPLYNQIVIEVLDKQIEETVGIHGLEDLFMSRARFSAGGDVNRLVVQEDNHTIVVQSSACWEYVQVAGEEGTVAGDTWLLFAEGETAYYAVEITYILQSGQSVQVWDDLQAYMSSFRVIR